MEDGSKCSDAMLQHILSAIEGELLILCMNPSKIVPGFFRSISLRDDSTLQDSLRLLTLWFKFGPEERVTLAVSEGASMVSVDTWLEVVPQASFNFPILRVLNLQSS